MIEAWFEEPGRDDNHPENCYGESAPEAVLARLRDVAKAHAVEKRYDDNPGFGTPAKQGRPNWAAFGLR